MGNFSQFDTNPAPFADAGLKLGTLKLAAGAGVNVAAAATQTMLNVSGKGVVNSIWMALSFNANANDLVLRVFVDGETTAAIDVDMGTLLASHTPPGAGTNVAYAMDHLAVQLRDDQATGFVFTLPMPFSNGIRIELNNPTGGLAIIYYQIAWTDTQPPPNYRLRSVGVKRTAAIVLPAAQTRELMNVNGSGWLATSHYAVTATAGDGSWVERNWQVYQGGEATPSFESTATEDWFGGAFTHMGQTFRGTPFWMIGGNNTTSSYKVANDLVKQYGGLRFDKSVRVVLGTDAAVLTQHTFCYAILYYLHI